MWFHAAYESDTTIPQKFLSSVVGTTLPQDARDLDGTFTKVPKDNTDMKASYTYVNP